jgi:hypothetical protein
MDWAGCVHSNVDPISRLRRNILFHDSPSSDDSIPTILDPEQDPLSELFSEISPEFEARTLQLAADFEERSSEIPSDQYSRALSMRKELLNYFLSTLSLNLEFPGRLYLTERL